MPTARGFEGVKLTLRSIHTSGVRCEERVESQCSSQNLSLQEKTCSGLVVHFYAMALLLCK